MKELMKTDHAMEVLDAAHKLSNSFGCNMDTALKAIEIQVMVELFSLNGITSITKVIDSGVKND